MEVQNPNNSTTSSTHFRDIVGVWFRSKSDMDNNGNAFSPKTAKCQLPIRINFNVLLKPELKCNTASPAKSKMAASWPPNG